MIAQVTRGGKTESSHSGAYAVSDASGTIVSAAGDIDAAVFPRSAIKAFQCLPLIESGAAIVTPALSAVVDPRSFVAVTSTVNALAPADTSADCAT